MCFLNRIFRKITQNSQNFARIHKKFTDFTKNFRTKAKNSQKSEQIMIKKRILIAADHAGYALKTQLCEFFRQGGINFVDLGTNADVSCDYADFAHALCDKMGAGDFGVLICGTGIGMSVAANRHKGVRCALCENATTARLAREHNNANVLALGARITGTLLAFDIVQTFINTHFEGGRHEKRIAKIEQKSQKIHKKAGKKDDKTA